MDVAESLNGWQEIHPKEVIMRSPKTLLMTVALLVVAFAAWAGSDAVVDKPRSDKDNKSVVAPAQPAKENGKQDQAPRSRDGDAQATESEHDAVRAPKSKPDAVQTRTSPKPVESITTPEPVPRREPTKKGEPGGLVEIAHPPRGGQGGGRGGRGGPGPRGPGFGWRGRRDEWRHRNYRTHGSWRFLFHFGPRVYFAPVHYPHIIRLPRTRIGVYVRRTGGDYVGVQFANAVREHLRERGLRVVYSPDKAQLELYIVSMEQDPEEPGYGSSISVSYIWYPGHKFITAQMVDAGIDEVDDLAQSVAEYADDLIDEYR